MEQIEYAYLRPKKAEALKAWFSEPLETRQALSLWQGQNATILPLRRQEGLLFGLGGVVDEAGAYVPLSAIPNRVEGAYPVENTPFQEETVVFCGYLVKHWGHFLVEAVARLWYFLEGDSQVDKYVFFLNEGEKREITGNYRAFFELFGIWDKLEFISQPVQYQKVLVPELAFHCRDYYSEKFLAVFDAVAAAVQPDPGWEAHENIYFSRSQLKKGSGNEFGMEALDSFYRRNGYTILYPEKVPLPEMIFYIRNAQTIATLSGSLPHNSLFARNGQNLVILERCVLNNDFQMNICRMRQLRATYIDANIPLYTVDMVGPFIMGYNQHLQRYAQDRKMLPPEDSFTRKSYQDRCFKGYMRAYQRLYRYQWYMADWYPDCADYLLEAYREGEALFEDFLNGSRPFLPQQYFQWHYFKQFVKRMLRKMNLRKG